MKRDLIMEELVIKEATNLKKHATKEELLKLDFTTLDGSSTDKCIYGQATGNCNSKRTLALIRKCATKIYRTKSIMGNAFNNSLNGSPKKIYIEPGYRLNYYTSPIENFLYKHNPDGTKKSKKILKLVKFLKDETKELVF